MRISDWSSDVCSSDLTGCVTVPVLWDRETATVVSNESADILRMFNAAFDGVGARPGDYWPEAHRAAIDAVKERKRVVEGKSVSVRVDLGGRRSMKKKK